MLEQDVSPIEELLVLQPEQTSVNIWAGSINVTAPCHYDGYHNFYVQVSGTKRFLLAAPGARGWLRPFPFLHPSHAQCQRRLRPKNKDGNVESDNATQDSIYYEAILEPAMFCIYPALVPRSHLVAKYLGEWMDTSTY